MDQYTQKVNIEVGMIFCETSFLLSGENLVLSVNFLDLNRDKKRQSPKDYPLS